LSKSNSIIEESKPSEDEDKESDSDFMENLEKLVYFEDMD